MISLKKIYTLLFFLGVFFLPFNEFEGLAFLGEYKNDASAYFFLIGFFILIIESLIRGKINIPYKHPLVIVLMVFIVWSAVSTLINIQSVLQNFFKDTSGLNRYFRQTISLLMTSVMFTVLFWNVIKNYSTYRIFILLRRVILGSFIFVAVYGFIEIAIVFFGMGFLTPVLQSFDIFPFVNTNLSGSLMRKGISSVTFEIPALGTFLVGVFPWMASYLLTEKRIYKYIPLAVVLILLFFSDSRSAMIVILAQLFIFFLLFLLDPAYKRGTKRALRYGTVVFVALLVFNSDKIIKTYKEKADRIDFFKNMSKDISNRSRFGIQYATLKVFSDHPVAGVGLGQNAYHAMHYYPYWATHDNWEFRLRYKNQSLKSFPPNYNFYTRTMAELGSVGILTFLFLLFLCFYYSFMLWKKSDDKNRFLGFILLLSFVGVSINWLQQDQFRQYMFWLSLVLLIKYAMEFRTKKLA